MLKILIIVTMFFFLNVKGYSECYTEAAKRYSVSDEVLRAIAKVESNNNHLALNILGEGYYPKNIQVARSILNSISSSFDIGIMQINKWWFDRFNYPYEWGFNSCWNINLAAYILSYEVKRANGDLWLAIGRYHSPTKWRQDIYKNKIRKALVYGRIED